jgi:hypothetical protein
MILELDNAILGNPPIPLPVQLPVPATDFATARAAELRWPEI